MMKNLDGINQVYFIGIGGAGMSGLAKVLHQKGLKVSGSDIKASSNTENLRVLGVKIRVGHKRSNIKDYDAVVVSSAIQTQNVELVEAKKKKIDVYQRAQMLALITNGKNVIAISGTHGKTTTTSMASLIFERNKLDPTFLIGGELNDIGSNAKYGRSNYFIAETDESDGSLLNFDPDLLVVTNIEADHLDYFETFEKVIALFKTFLQKIKAGGKAIIYGDHTHIKNLLPFIKSEVISYGESESNDFYYDNFRQKDLGSSFDVYYKGKKLGNISLKVPGEHNVLNSLAALIVGIEAGLKFSQIKSALKDFSGVKRRFEYVGKINGAFIYDDYAHHPTEVNATLKAAANEKSGRIVCIFQPHRFSRTSFLAEDFGYAFEKADLVVVTDVYSSGEKPIPGVSGKLIADSIIEKENYKNLAYVPRLRDVVSFLEKEVKSGDMIITMGAGDISSIGQRLLA